MEHYLWTDHVMFYRFGRFFCDLFKEVSTEYFADRYHVL